MCMEEASRETHLLCSHLLLSVVFISEDSHWVIFFAKFFGLSHVACTKEKPIETLVLKSLSTTLSNS